MSVLELVVIFGVDLEGGLFGECMLGAGCLEYFSKWVGIEV